MSLLLESIRKSYREPGGRRLPVLGIERFEMKQGEQVALLGSSGGGKTTLLNIISGILTPDSGHAIGQLKHRQMKGIRTQFQMVRSRGRIQSGLLKLLGDSRIELPHW